MSLIVWLIVYLIITGIVLWLVNLIVANLPVSPPIRNLILALTGLLLLLYLLQHFGVLGHWNAVN